MFFFFAFHNYTINNYPLRRNHFIIISSLLKPEVHKSLYRSPGLQTGIWCFLWPFSFTQMNTICFSLLKCISPFHTYITPTDSQIIQHIPFHQLIYCLLTCSCADCSLNTAPWTSLTHSLTHPLTHSLTHSLNQNQSIS